MSNSLTPEEKRRYRRQMILPQLGEKGQQRLKEATVMIAGLGGLGSILAYHMTAAGVGHLKIADMDYVADHNLNRQILHTTLDIGKLKTDSALGKLNALNPDCRINAFPIRITQETVDVMVDGCDLILDGTDNITTRRILNRSAMKKGIPFIFGGVNGFNGMASTFIPSRFGCLECIFPEKNSHEPEETGVIGPIVGVIGSIQCMEAVKIIVGMEPSLVGTLLHFRGLDMRVKQIAIEKDPDCSVCVKKKY